MAKAKQFTRPPKKQKPKVTEPETADDFQEAADREEEAGGKHRAGDPAKSGRAFVRALEYYDKGLQQYPTNFDLAYNKARLELEITQHPALVAHIGVPIVDLLTQTLESHRYALRLNEENPDVLFNTCQVLSSLAEQFSEYGRSQDAITLLQESLELLSSCLSRQEMLLEQQQADFDDADDGGVSLELDEQLATGSASEVSEQTAHVETPASVNDLLDTLHASMSSLTTLVSLVELPALQTFGDMAQSLTEEKAPNYISLLPEDLRDAARFQVGIDRAIFIAAFADAQFSYMAIELDTYSQRLEAFTLPGKERSAHLLCAEAEARTELCLSALYRQVGPDAPVQLSWKQLSAAQDLYNAAIKLDDDDAKDRKAQAYHSKGDVELLRFRLASIANSPLSESVKKSAKTLIQNAQTFFKGAAQLARGDGDHDLETKAKQRWLIAADIAALVYSVETKEAPFAGNTASVKGDLLHALESAVEEGLVDTTLGEEIMKRIQR